jgi:hypothetical protein
MKRSITAFFILALSGLAHGYGLPFAVDSLEKAQAQARQSVSRHVLVFYTSPT